MNAGAIPVLVSLLNSPDTDVQYYCTTAISNIAVDGARVTLTHTTSVTHLPVSKQPEEAGHDRAKARTQSGPADGQSGPESTVPGSPCLA